MSEGIWRSSYPGRCYAGPACHVPSRLAGSASWVGRFVIGVARQRFAFAPAVTITGSPDHATCGTFISIDARGGLPVASAHVGACQRVECVHNSDLLCTAESVVIGAGGDTASCLTYQAR